MKITTRQGNNTVKLAEAQKKRKIIMDQIFGLYLDIREYPDIHLLTSKFATFNVDFLTGCHV